MIRIASAALPNINRTGTSWWEPNGYVQRTTGNAQSVHQSIAYAECLPCDPPMIRLQRVLVSLLGHRECSPIGMSLEEVKEREDEVHGSKWKEGGGGSSSSSSNSSRSKKGTHIRSKAKKAYL